MKLQDHNGVRPAGPPDKCFYCGHVVGGHSPGCVCLVRSVVLRLKMELDVVVDVPEDWSVELIEFQRNDGTRCADTDIEALLAWRDKHTEEDGAAIEGPCFCGATEYEYVREATPQDHMDLPVLFEENADN